MSKGIFVIGMHRSGTSALSGILDLMGFSSGAEIEMVSKNFDNEKSFFERNDVYQLKEIKK